MKASWKHASIDRLREATLQDTSRRIFILTYNIISQDHFTRLFVVRLSFVLALLCMRLVHRR